jgi:hypothetical protein
MRLAFLLVFVLAGAANAADEVSRDVGGLSIRVAPRPPQGMAAFYEARGFPPDAIASIRDACFLGVMVVNHTPEVIWFDLDRWEFRDADGPVRRLTLGDWASRWDAVGLPWAKRATFRWTQLPDRRDLQPDEPVAANVAIARPHGPVSVLMRFRSETTGKDRTTEFTNIECGEPKP